MRLKLKTGQAHAARADVCTDCRHVSAPGEGPFALISDSVHHRTSAPRRRRVRAWRPAAQPRSTNTTGSPGPTPRGCHPHRAMGSGGAVRKPKTQNIGLILIKQSIFHMTIKISNLSPICLRYVPGTVLILHLHQTRMDARFSIFVSAVSGVPGTFPPIPLHIA